MMQRQLGIYILLPLEDSYLINLTTPSCFPAIASTSSFVIPEKLWSFSAYRFQVVLTASNKSHDFVEMTVLRASKGTVLI